MLFLEDYDKEMHAADVQEFKDNLTQYNYEAQ